MTTAIAHALHRDPDGRVHHVRQTSTDLPTPGRSRWAALGHLPPAGNEGWLTESDSGPFAPLVEPAPTPDPAAAGGPR